MRAPVSCVRAAVRVMLTHAGEHDADDPLLPPSTSASPLPIAPRYRRSADLYRSVCCALPWRDPCRPRAIRLILSSRSSFRASPFSSGVTKVVATPFAPARPVRPMRWTKSSEPFGRSKFTTCAMCETSMPRAATSVATSTRALLSANFFSAEVRCDCVRSP